MFFGYFCDRRKTCGVFSLARTPACPFLHPRDKILGCSQPGVAWVCVLWWLATLLVWDQFFKIKRLWRFEERCTAVLFGTTVVMAVYAPDCGKDLEVYETCILNVTKVLREGRRGGAKELHITEDLNVALGLLSTDEDDNEELNEMYGSLCWQGCENDHGGFKKPMWYRIMKKFSCKAASTWSKCG